MNDFSELHLQKGIFLLGNVWDPISALIMQQKGFLALGTTSWGLANALGFKDGEKIQFDQLVGAVANILAVAEVPVSVDIESGYGESITEIVDNVMQLAQLGCAGINIEDATSDRCLKDPDQHSLLLKAIKEKLVQSDYQDFFINARIDTYLLMQNPLQNTIERARQYVDVGADGVFVPGMVSTHDIDQFVTNITAPLNVMVLPDLDFSEAEQAGVKRISFGNGISDAVISYTERLCESLLADRDFKVLFSNPKIETVFAG